MNPKISDFGLAKLFSIDSNINPKISDFGLAKLFNSDSSAGNTSRIAGT